MIFLSPAHALTMQPLVSKKSWIQSLLKSMGFIRWVLLGMVMCVGQALAESATFQGAVGNRRTEFHLEWAADGSIAGDYGYVDEEGGQYRVLGRNGPAESMELSVYSGQLQTARMRLKKDAAVDRIGWVGMPEGHDGVILKVNFSRQAMVLAAESAGGDEVAPAGGKVAKDRTNGALVWCANLGPIEWSGGTNPSGFAEGKGALVFFDRAGNIFSGTVNAGNLAGEVSIKYPSSPERAHYVGGYSNWAENGTGTMTYNNGKVVSGIWKDGELVSNTAAQAGVGMPQDAYAEAEVAMPDPDTAAENLQTTYDLLKGSLQGNALQTLKLCQRAWIKYNEKALQISASLWDRPGNSWEGSDRFDAMMAAQRTHELQFVIDRAAGRAMPSPAPGDLDTKATALAAQLRKIETIGRIKPEEIAALRQHWEQAAQLAVLADPQNGSDGQASRQLRALATENLSQILTLWLAAQEVALVEPPAPLLAFSSRPPPLLISSSQDSLNRESQEIFSLSGSRIEPHPSPGPPLLQQSADLRQSN